MAGVSAAVNVEFFENRKHEGRIANKSGTKNLYFDFFYNGVRIEKSTGLKDNPPNRLKAEAMLKKILEMKEDGTLEFAKIFPGASEEEKEFHTLLERGEYAPTPKAITFEGYVEKWYKKIWVHYTKTKQQDFKSVINYRLLPFFGKMTFHQITGVTMQQFVATLKHHEGKKSGETLARSTMVNILQIFKTIWDDAVIEHRWTLFDPLKGIKKHIPKKGRKKVDVFRIDEWKAIISSMDEYYQPVAKLMILTGLMASEVAGLKSRHITESHLEIEESIVRSVEKDDLKTNYRFRRIPITRAIREILDQATQSAKGEYLFTIDDGRTFSAELFYKKAWVNAVKASGVKYRKPYTTRHTFAAWALLLSMDPNQLVSLMGHASKQMIYEVYGKYTEGLEKDKQAIQEYFGNDFNPKA